MRFSDESYIAHIEIFNEIEDTRGKFIEFDESGISQSHDFPNTLTTTTTTTNPEQTQSSQVITKFFQSLSGTMSSSQVQGNTQLQQSDDNSTSSTLVTSNTNTDSKLMKEETIEDIGASLSISKP